MRPVEDGRRPSTAMTRTGAGEPPGSQPITRRTSWVGARAGAGARAGGRGGSARLQPTRTLAATQARTTGSCPRALTPMLQTVRAGSVASADRPSAWICRCGPMTALFGAGVTHREDRAISPAASGSYIPEAAARARAWPESARAARCARGRSRPSRRSVRPASDGSAARSRAARDAAGAPDWRGRGAARDPTRSCDARRSGSEAHHGAHVDHGPGPSDQVDLSQIVGLLAVERAKGPDVTTIAASKYRPLTGSTGPVVFWVAPGSPKELLPVAANRWSPLT